MDSAKPALSFNENCSMNLKNNSNEFRLIFGTIGESLYFELEDLKSFPINKYQNILDLNSLKKINCWFNQFSSIDKLAKLFNKMMKSNKFKIKDEINILNKHIYFLNPLDEDDIISIELLPKEKNQEEMIKELYKKNILLEQKIKSMEEKFEEKINTLEKKINLICKQKNVPENAYSLLNDSLIISKKEEIDLLNSWISPGNRKEYKLIYSASKNGDKVTDFHKYCDNIAPTLILGKTPKGYIFGGFTNVTWNYNKDENLYDSDAFVFSLNQKKKFHTMDKYNAIRKVEGYCTIFGNGSNSLQIENNILSCSTHWSNPNSSYGDNLNLTENQEFSVVEFEVFCINYY